MTQNLPTCISQILEPLTQDELKFIGEFTNESGFARKDIFACKSSFANKSGFEV